MYVRHSCLLTLIDSETHYFALEISAQFICNSYVPSAREVFDLKVMGA